MSGQQVEYTVFTQENLENVRGSRQKDGKLRLFIFGTSISENNQNTGYRPLINDTDLVCRGIRTRQVMPLINFGRIFARTGMEKRVDEFKQYIQECSENDCMPSVVEIYAYSRGAVIALLIALSMPDLKFVLFLQDPVTISSDGLDISTFAFPENVPFAVITLACDEKKETYRSLDIIKLPYNKETTEIIVLGLPGKHDQQSRIPEENPAAKFNQWLAKQGVDPNSFEEMPEIELRKETFDGRSAILFSKLPTELSPLGQKLWEKYWQCHLEKDLKEACNVCLQDIKNIQEETFEHSSNLYNGEKIVSGLITILDSDMPAIEKYRAFNEVLENKQNKNVLSYLFDSQNQNLFNKIYDPFIEIYGAEYRSKEVINTFTILG